MAVSLQDLSRTVGRDYTMASAFVWLLFEYFLTLDQEVELFWGQKPTVASILFLSNRYLPLLCSAWWTPWWSSSSSYGVCVMQELAGGIGEYLLYVPVGAFTAMRAYALSARKRRTRAIITFLLSVSPSIMALVLSPWIRFHHDPNNGGCSMAYDAPVLLQVVAVVSSRAFLVLADIIVVCITWSATYMHRLKSHGKPPSISDVLFRDGTMYFVAQLILNTIYLVSVLVPADVFGAKDLNSIASLYIQPATSILITHFLLDLQQASRRTMHLPAMNAGNWENMMGSVVLVPADVAEDSETDVADGPGP